MPKPSKKRVSLAKGAAPVVQRQASPVYPQINGQSTVDTLVGLDLGGSLSKICIFVPEVKSPGSDIEQVADFITSNESFGQTGVRETKLSFESPRLQGRFHFIRFETSRTEGAVRLLKNTTLFKPGQVRFIRATGGGALKYKNLFLEEMGIKLEPEDELETVVRGIVFTLLECPKTCYAIEPDAESPDAGARPMNKIPRPLMMQDLFPLLVVNIGSGVSIIKVDSPSSMRRVSGTAVGGGTYFGLCKLLTRCETFDEAMDMAERGDSRRVNMLVSDIYGGGYDKVGLPGTLTASFFGKAASAHGATRPASSGSHEDVIEARR